MKTYDPEGEPSFEAATAASRRRAAVPGRVPLLARLLSVPAGGPVADPLRRRLMLALPSGLALASPLALVACGGGGGDAAGTSGSTGTGVDLHDAGRAFAGSGTLVPTALTVTLPAGATAPGSGKLAAHTLVGGFGKVSAGATMLPLAFGGLQLVTVYTETRLPVLFAFLDSATPGAIDAKSTAVALLAFALGAPVFEQGVFAAWVGQIAASDAVAPFAAVIASELARDIHALAAFSPAIEAALGAAAQALIDEAKAASAMAARRRGVMGVSIDAAGERSGAEPVLAETFNTVYVQNSKLRRAWYAIHRESSTDAAGTVTIDNARTVAASGDVAQPPAFASAGDIIGSVTAASYGGDDTGLAFGKTDETTLAIADGAKSTAYSVTVLMAGNEKLGFDRTWASQNLTADELRKVDIEQFSTDHLGLQMLFVDLLLPMFLGWCGGKIGDAGAGLGERDFKKKAELALLGEMFTILTTTLPPIAAKLKSDPAYGIADALGEIITQHLVSMVDVPVGGRTISVPVLSSFSYEMVILLLKFIAYEKLGAADGEKLLTFLEGNGQDKDVGTLYSWVIGRDASGGETSFDVDTETIQHAGMGVALKALGTVNAGLGWLNQARVATDVATSKLVERWELTVVKANVRLTPNPLKIDQLGVSYDIKAEIVDNDNDDYGAEKGSWRFDWTCTAQYGDLYKPDIGGGTREQNRFSTSNANATCQYMARTLADPGAAEEVITIDAWFEPVGTAPAFKVGSARATLEFKQEFTLTVSPKTGGRLPTGITMPVYGFFNEAVPDGASVEWTWTHAGVGTLTSPPTDGQVRQHAVSLATGDVAGFVTLGVSAKVTIPATATSAGRTVVTRPVSVSYGVDRGVRTVTFECGGGVFPCDAGCGVSDYTAFIVPKIAGALNYSGTFSEFGYGPCNRTVSWITTKADGGGCNFPITHHPIAAGESAPAWAVWIGFGGPLNGPGKFVATITLPA